MSISEQKYPHLFSPITIRGKRIKNRIVASPHSGGPNLYCAGKDGMSNFTETAAAYFGKLARGGAAIVNTGHLGVDPRYLLGSNEEYFNFFELDHIHEHQLAVMHQMTDLIHSYGAIASIELNHSGHYGRPLGDAKLIGPVSTVKNGREITEMDEEEMNRVADYFAQAAWIGKRGGFDMVLVHGGHNWLIGEFLSPIENTRKDKYGGNAEKRVRFPIMVLDRIREKVGDDMIISMRYSVLEDAPGGLTLEESIEQAKLLQDHVDILQCSRGMIADEFSDGFMFPMPFHLRGCNIPYAKMIKSSVTNCKIEGIGGVNEPEMADRFIAEGSCDLVAMARSFIADPDWAEKARRGCPEDIRPCLRCLRCLNYAGHPQTGTSICTVNPRRIFPHPLPPVTEKGTIKKVAVIGGGPAGLKAAYEIAGNGHNVTLYEKGDRLGGRLGFADYMNFKSDIKRYREYLITQVNKMNNITINLNTEATPEKIKEEEFDSAVIAIGADSNIPAIDGIDQENVWISDRIFGNERKLGDRVAVIGGGYIGCEITVYLQTLGKKVDVIEISDTLIKDGMDLRAERFWTIYYMTHEFKMENDDVSTYREIDRVKIHLSSTCIGIKGNTVTLQHADKSVETIEADSIILSTGFHVNEEVRDNYMNCACNVIFAGDCQKVANILGTSSSAYYASLQV